MSFTLKSDGFKIAAGILGPPAIEALRIAVEDLPKRHRAGVRNLLQGSRAVADTALTPSIKSLADEALGSDAFPVRATLFDKSPEANWRVPWHQDTAIAVVERVETPNFLGWSVKEGVPHVHPPTEVLEGMIALRIHLDDCELENGPLRVLPGSHRSGKLELAQIEQFKERFREVPCTVKAGDVLLMFPLLLHASSPSEKPSRRRVIHIEYASQGLPNGLRWFDPGTSLPTLVS